MSGAADRITDRLRRLGGLKSLVLKGRDFRTRVIDRWLNIDTVNPRGERFGLENTNADPVAYEPVDYLLLRRYMRPVKLGSDDVVYDIGCGMGRMLCLFARRNVKQVVGIEYDARLADIARLNVASMRGRKAPIEVRQGDAIEADYDAATVIWMFNPFGPQTMSLVLDRVGESLQRVPRRLQVAYINPLHESLFAVRPWLRHVGIEKSPFFKTYHASYWVAESSHAPPRE
jgi:SAM-dependent methyltransferase